MGIPTFQDLKTAISTNLIKNTTVTCEDVDLAQMIYGKDIATVKGKMTRINSSKLIHDKIYIPPKLIEHNKNVHLSIDVISINGLLFMTSISHDIFYRSAQFVPNKQPKHYQQCLVQLLELYKNAHFTITAIHCDNEFKSAFDDIKDKFKFTVYPTPAQTHVSHAERNNRVIKERVQCLYHNLKFQRVPKTILIYLVQEATQKINYFPARYGISKTYSPYMIIHQTNIDFNTHGKHYPGEYVLGHNDLQIKNTMQPRALDCIYLRTSSLIYGKHELFHISTKQVITRKHCTSAVINQSIIDQIHQIADNEKNIK